MKKLLFLIWVSLICFVYPTTTKAAFNTWTQKANFPGTARVQDAAFSIGQYGFIGLGSNVVGAGTYYTDFYRYNSKSNTWQSIATYPGHGDYSPVSCSIEGKGYVGFGYNGAVQGDWWSYDTGANSWTAQATFPGKARYDAAWFVIGHKLYLVGGSGGGPPYLNDVWVYDAHQNSWKQLSNSPMSGTDGSACFAIGPNGYICGGWNGSYMSSALWKYDTGKDSWTSITSSFPLPLGGDPKTFVVGSKAYVCVGDENSSGKTLPVGYAYDTVTKSWSEFTNMGANGIERKYTAVFTIGNCGYMGTGFDSTGVLKNDLWQYNTDTTKTIPPTCNIWKEETPFSGAARDYATGFSIGKYAFMGLGWNGSTTYSDFYKWNQQTNTWKAIANYPGAGELTPIAFAIEGKGYVGLGSNGNSVATDLWSYDTASNSWTQMASIPGKGRYDNTWFVIGHKVYVIGGSPGGQPYLNDAWVYDAHQNSWKQLNNSPAYTTDGMAAFAIGNHGYIGGGWNGYSAGTAFWQYDTATDTWTSIANWPVPSGITGDPRSFVMDGAAYICTGATNGSQSATLTTGYMYDTTLHAWSTFTDLLGAGVSRTISVVFTIGNYAYLGSGKNSTGTYLNDFWQYTPCIDTIANEPLATSNSPLCAGTTLTLLASNVTGATYTWTGPNGFISNLQNPTIVNASVSDTGTYSVYATVNSVKSAVRSIKVIINPTPNSLTITTTPSQCGLALGTASVSVSGGTRPYQYSWTNGSTSSTVSNLSVGVYQVVVNDSNKCSATAIGVINNSNGDTVKIDSVVNIKCYGQSTGSIKISAAGTAPFTYSWSNGDTVPSIKGLSAGPYQVTVTDAANCVAIQNISITQPTAVNLSVASWRSDCSNANGSAIVHATGGTSTFTYNWNNGATTDSIIGLAAGIYKVSVTDSNGCKDTAQVAVSNKNGPVVKVDSILSANCIAGKTGAIFISDSGGTSPYSYLWSNSVTTQNVNNIEAGIYNITVTDMAGCIGTASAKVPGSLPAGVSICMVTVDTLQKNLMIWNRTSERRIQAYNVYRETTSAGVYALAATVPADSLTTWEDPVAKPLSRSYRYELSELDSCGEESALSAPVKTMHLTINQGVPTGTTNLIWDNYEGINIPYYIICRDSIFGHYTPIDTIPNNGSQTYSDYYISSYNQYYSIGIYNPAGCSPTKGHMKSDLNSYSNKEGISGIIMTGQSTLNEDENLSAYPNPTSGIFNLHLNLNNTQSMSIRLINTMGQVIYNEDCGKVKGPINRKLDISDYSKGVYIMQVITNNGVLYSKIVLQ